MNNDLTSTRPRVSKEVADLVALTFPGVAFDEAVGHLLDQYKSESGDHISCAQTEVWIKAHRLEEAISLLALTNMEIADVYRRTVAHELLFLRESSASLTAAAADFQTKTKA
jgi:hypothetical protein